MGGLHLASKTKAGAAFWVLGAGLRPCWLRAARVPGRRPAPWGSVRELKHRPSLIPSLAFLTTLVLVSPFKAVPWCIFPLICDQKLIEKGELNTGQESGLESAMLQKSLAVTKISLSATRMRTVT